MRQKSLRRRWLSGRGAATAALVALFVIQPWALGSAAGQGSSGPVPDAMPSDQAALRLRGLEYGFNLDYDQALSTFQEAVRRDPDDATASRLAAAALWMQVLFEQGAVTVEDYLGQAKSDVSREPPSPERARAFRDYIDRAMTIADARVRRNPSDADAQFQLGAAAGLRASYIASVEGHVRDSVGIARKAYLAQKRCLTLDPGRKDAGLIVGLYQYAIASLSFPVKLIARLIGFDSGKESGLHLVEEAAAYPANPQTQTNARFVLVLLYSREGRHEDALRMVRQLENDFPRNRLLRLEAGSALLRAGRPAEALRALDDGLARFTRDPRPHARGEEARWRYVRATALVQLRRSDDALRELQAAQTADPPAWLKDRIILAARALRSGSR